MKKMTKKQIGILKLNIVEMIKSNEQFIFMIFKNPNGTDNITEFSYNMIPEKLGFYFRKALNRGKLKYGK